MNRTSRHELLEGIWRHVLVGPDGAMSRTWLDDFAPQSAIPEGERINPGTLLASLHDSGLLKRSLQMTVQQLSLRWDQIRPEAKAAILLLGLKYHHHGVISLPNLTTYERVVLSVRWDVSDVMYESYRVRMLAETREWGLDLEREVFVPGSLNLGTIFLRCPETLASLVRARIEWDLAAALAYGADARPAVRSIIQERANKEGHRALGGLRNTIYSLRGEGDAPSLANIELTLKPVRAAIGVIVGRIDELQPTPDQLSSFISRVASAPRPPELPPVELVGGSFLSKVARHRQRYGTLYLIVSTLIALILAALALMFR